MRMPAAGINIKRSPRLNVLARIVDSRLPGMLASLYGLRLVNYVCPLVLVPYLARVLGPQGWGVYAFAEACGRGVQMLVEYGFQLAGVREVALRRNDRKELAALVSGMLGAQLAMGAAALAVLFLLTAAFGPFRQAAALLPGAFLYGLGLGLSPIWYFQGTERLARMVTIDILSRMIGVGGVFLLVRSPGDNWKALTIQGVLACSGAVAGWGLVSMQIPLRFAKPADIWDGLHGGWTLFLSKGATLLISALNPVLAAFSVGAREVGLFFGADRICRAAVNSLHPMNQAFYPRLVLLVEEDHRRGARFACRAGTAMLLHNLLLSAVLYFGAGPLVKLILGAQYMESAGILKILAFIPLANALNNLLGLQWMLALRMDRAYLGAVVCAGLTNLWMFPWLAARWGTQGMAWGSLSVELLLLAAIGVQLAWRRADPFHALLGARPSQGADAEVVGHVGRGC